MATDVYNLGILTAYAITNSQGIVAGTAVANTTAYSLILAQQAALTELKYSKTGRCLWVIPAVVNLLKRDPEFKQDCDTSYADSKKGIVGMIDGLTIKEVPSTYFVTNFQFMITCPEIGVAVNKFDMVRTLDNDKDVDGWICQGRRYHDMFILNQRGTGIRVYTKS